MTNPLASLLQWRENRLERLGREKVMLRRLAHTCGIIAGLFLSVVGFAMRNESAFVHEGREEHSMFFGDISSWHSIFTEGHAVIDTAMITFSFWLIAWIVCTRLNGQGSPEAIAERQTWSRWRQARYHLAFMVGMFLAAGGIGGAVGAAAANWYMGFEMFIAFGLAANALMIAAATIILLGGVILGFVVETVTGIWSVVGKFRAVRPLVAAGNATSRYFSAEDIEEPVNPEPQLAE